MKSKELLFFLIPALMLISGIIGYIIRIFIGKGKLQSAETLSETILRDAKREAEAIKKESILEAKDKLLKDKSYFEKEMRERRSEVGGIEKRLNQKEENIERRLNMLEKKEYEAAKKEKNANEKLLQAEESLKNYQKQLEKLSRMTTDEAKNLLLESMRVQASREAAGFINKIEEEAK
ncbi:MAG: DUF3552 domain-containing protein, partial [Actinomycetia bacterium]|nr:DUF3552 domain-containing protein [Actinomycetes bacterium]